MFTGIVTDIGTICEIYQQDDGDVIYTLSSAYDTSQIEIGASISCSGACLTVIEKEKNTFKVQVSQESLDKTNIKNWKKGFKVNLEQGLSPQNLLDGHIVTGHIDGISEVKSIEVIGDSKKITFSLPVAFSGFIAPKGSITLDGVSLTVNDVYDSDTSVDFTINIIPHTQENTTLGLLCEKDLVNFEIDIIARYIGRYLKRQNVG